MKTNIEKMIDAIKSEDIINAKKHLLSALMEKCEKKMNDVLNNNEE